ncbi:OmpA family protein [Acetobacter sacchari]|uniref:OmpA family protein n=1 Tax=Acetobacter sacchari TaxID=2661687 RepID=A0ABS3LRD6_9PROT|nr:flagellar motor protein MotB [Acetobacter sacchari]MBO1358468.1 OmpA family protein [Acetobacter sacchari]
MAKRNGHNKGPTIIVRRGGGGGAGHHGGAWKIAYADFVTAMMAFFLVMWLINATTEQRRRGIANFFNPMANSGSPALQVQPQDTPTNASSSDNKQTATSAESRSAGSAASAGSASASGAAGAASLRAAASKSLGVIAVSEPGRVGGFGPEPGAVPGRSDAGSGPAHEERGAMVAPQPSFPDRSLGRQTLAPPAILRIVPVGGDRAGPSIAVGEADAARAEQRALEAGADQLKRVLARTPTVAADAGQVAVAVIPAGLKIELSESDRKSMFDNGSARLTDRAVALLRVIAPYLTALPEKLSVYGYADGALYRGRKMSNWTLSGARADSARQILTDNGFPDQRLREVVGVGDHDLARPDDPGAPENRRVVLILHRDHPAPESVGTSAAASNVGAVK